MDAFKKTIQVVLYQIPKANSGWIVRFYSKRSDHLKLSSNMTLITSNGQYNPDRSTLAAYNKEANYLKKTPVDPSKKPIVLLYGWLMSQDKFLKKFSDIYSDHGFDVLRVKVKLSEVLWPQSVKATVHHLRKFLLSHLDRPYLVHGFSVGGFVHTELVKSLLESDDEDCKHAMKQIKGQIFDSVVDMYGVADGVSASVYLNDPIRRALTRMTIQSYINLTRKQVFEVYAKDSVIFHSNPLLVPSLMFYSKADTIGAAGPIEAAIASWRSKNVPVTQKCWESSEHVGHYKADPEVYTSYLNNFLTSLGFIQATAGVGAEVHVDGSKTPCDGGLRDSDANSPNRFKTDIKKGGGDGGDGKPIEVLMEVAESEMDKAKKEIGDRKKATAVSKLL